MERPANTAIVRINSDLPCLIYRFGKEIGRAGANDYTEIYLPKGKHRLSFVSTENSCDKVDIEKEILDFEYEDIIDVPLLQIRDKRVKNGRAELESNFAPWFTIKKEGNEVILRKCSKGIFGGIVIPDIVTSIGDEAFKDCDYLTSITIPDSVTSIGDEAFSRCSGLTSITIPDSVRSIGVDAFNDCKSLPVENGLRYADTYLVAVVDDTKSSYIIKDGTRFIGSRVFWFFRNLTSITIPNSVKSIGDYAFGFCSNLKSITIPESVTSIGDEAFSACTGLTSINIPNSVSSIGSRAFSSCSGLTSIAIPESVMSIGDDAFFGCERLPVEDDILYADTYLVAVVDDTKSSYTIKEGTRFIAQGACSECPHLTSITIPNCVERIGADAFYKCKALTSITIPNSVKSIGMWAFSDCRSLLSVTCLAKDMPIIGEEVFENVPQGSATLYVPASALEAYRAAEQWKEFGRILPIKE